ncbi:MAG: hypothetical protein IAI49_02200 [Candidatus Eremiobacteraeota bacterium]|nr:hypothetical protein [Candidatus Eremiobacteraeota bacterium]
MAEWKFLVPGEIAKSALQYRFEEARFGGASWAGALAGLGSLPAWLPAGSLAFSAISFSVLAVFPASKLLRASLGRKSGELTFNDVLAVHVALVAAFVIAFRGTDPNLWYPLTIVALWFFASAKPLSPFPLVLGSVMGLAFYSTVGVREFVNQTYFWPVGEGLLGNLSTLRNVFDLTVDALLIAFIVAVSGSSAGGLFSRKSPYFVALFFSCVIATATGVYALDVVICGAALANILGIVFRCVGSEDRYDLLKPVPFSMGVSIGALVAAGACLGVRNGMAAVCALAMCLLAARHRVGTCDVILGIGGMAVISVQPGSGIVSTVGWLAVLTTLFAMIVTVVKDRGRPSITNS